MTNLLKKILESGNLYKSAEVKKHFSMIKKDISCFFAYTSAFIEYKFLLDLKKNLIASNKVTDCDLTLFTKWKLLLLYNEEGKAHKKSEYFDQRFNKKLGSHNQEDIGMIRDSLLELDKYIDNQWNKKKEPRFSTIFPQKRMEDVGKVIVKYFLYKKGMLKLINEDTFFEDYFHEENFIEPLDTYFSDTLMKSPEAIDRLWSYWLEYFAMPRVYLFSEQQNTKKITGYSRNPLFKGKSEYNYFELKRKIVELDELLAEELSEVFSSDWLKSKILEILLNDKCLQAEAKEISTILSDVLGEDISCDQKNSVVLDLLCFNHTLYSDISNELKEQLLKATSKK